MVLAAIRWSFSSEARFRTDVSPREICGEPCGIGAVFLRVFTFSPVNDAQPILCTHLDSRVALTRLTKWRSLGFLQQAMLFRKLERIGQKIYLLDDMFGYIFYFIQIYSSLYALC